MPRPAGKHYDEWIHLRVPAATGERLRRVCEKQNINISRQIRVLIDGFLDETRRR